MPPMNDDNWNALMAALGMTEAWDKLMADDDDFVLVLPPGDAAYQATVASFGLTPEEFAAEMLRRMG